MRPTNSIIGILCADLHLSLYPPVARAGEADWFAAMKKPLDQIKALADEHDAVVLCAGDVFNHWRSPPELINFALQELPDMLAIPGQHDLPLHRLEDIRKSAFWTLVEAGKVKIPKDVDDEEIHGFPWGVPIHSIERLSKALTIALVHTCIWIEGSSYPGIPPTSKASRYAKHLKGFDVAVFGDNHKGFQTRVGQTEVFNCGTLMRRKSDEASYKPRVGLLHKSGKVEPHFLDTSGESITILNPEVAKEIEGLEDFLAGLSQLQATTLDYREAVKRFFDEHPIRAEVREALLEAMDDDGHTE